jgi:hypothetical protein
LTDAPSEQSFQDFYAVVSKSAFPGGHSSKTITISEPKRLDFHRNFGREKLFIAVYMRAKLDAFF